MRGTSTTLMTDPQFQRAGTPGTVSPPAEVSPVHPPGVERVAIVMATGSEKLLDVELIAKFLNFPLHFPHRRRHRGGIATDR